MHPSGAFGMGHCMHFWTGPVTKERQTHTGTKTGWNPQSHWASWPHAAVEIVKLHELFSSTLLSCMARLVDIAIRAVASLSPLGMHRIYRVVQPQRYLSRFCDPMSFLRRKLVFSGPRCATQVLEMWAWWLTEKASARLCNSWHEPCFDWIL